MEDKEKLMKEQEQKLRFQSQPPLNPQSNVQNKPVMSLNKPTAPRDLTSTLISSNLSSMTLSSNQPMNNMNPVSPLNNQMYSPQGGAQGMMGGGFSSQPMPAFGGNFNAQPLATPPRGPQMQAMRNMTSLDSLLVTSSNRPKVSMNQMSAFRPAYQHQPSPGVPQQQFANFALNQPNYNMPQNQQHNVMTGNSMVQPQKQLSQSSSVNSALDDLLS